MKPYNPIKSEDKIINEPLTKDEQKFVDSFTLDKLITHDEAKEIVDKIYVHTDWDTKDKLLAYISQQEKLSVEFLRLKNRETPMKVNIRYATNDSTSMLEKQYCPQCYEMLHEFKPSYCPYCGQALDWGKDK